MSFEEALPHPPAPLQPRLPSCLLGQHQESPLVRFLGNPCRAVPAQRNTRATGSQPGELRMGDFYQRWVFLHCPHPSSKHWPCLHQAGSKSGSDNEKNPHNILVEKKELQLQIESKLYVYMNLLF